MKNRSRAIAIVVAVVLVRSAAAAQQQPAPNQPIELPEIIVTGKERVDIPGSTKQAPTKPPMLGRSRLDSLNAVEKQPVPPLPSASLPVPQPDWAIRPGWLDASLGQYLTPEIAAGYTFTTGGYRIDARAGVESSLVGYQPNTEYTRASIRALSSYVAPEKFIVFGGSTTEVDLEAGLDRYRLFARSDAPTRSVDRLGAGLGVEGTYDGFRYRAGASYRMIGLGTADRSSSDNTLHGHLAVENRWQRFDVGGRASVDLRSYAGASYPFVEVAAYGRLATETMRLTAGIGIQTSSSTADVTRGGLLLNGALDLFVAPTITFSATARSGLRATSFADAVGDNPYVADTLLLDASYEVFNVGGRLHWHPTVRLSVSAGAQLAQTDRTPVWVAADSGMFRYDYHTTTRLDIPVDVRFLLSSADALTGEVRFTTATVASYGRQPYVPTVQVSASYDRDWSDDLRTRFGVVYVGDRAADLDERRSLSGYVDLRADASYRLLHDLRLTARVNNALGSTMILWEGYRERGIFISGGLTWTF